MNNGKPAWWTSTLGFIVLHCVVWWAAQLVMKPALDSYGDMVEVYAWSQHWLMGSDKHPQFLPWVARIWFSVMPQSVASFYLLSAINLAVGLLGIRALGRALGMKGRQVAAALALQVLAFPYLTLPDKLNMNAILLPLWPWVTVAFLRVAQTVGRRQMMWAAVLGVLSGVAVLAKYYSAILLLSLFLASLLPALRHIWRGYAFPVFVVTFAATITPHLIWLIAHRQSVSYAMEQGAGGVNWREIGLYALVPLLYWPIPLIVGLVRFYRGSVLRRVANLLHCGSDAEGTVLWAVCVGPLVLTLLAGMIGVAELSLPWSIPIGFGYTLLLIRNARTGTPQKYDGQARAFRWIWPALIAVALFYVWSQITNREPWYSMPEAASAQSLHAAWATQNPAAPSLGWAAQGNDAARIAFFSDGARIEALPALPDALPGYYPPLEGWKNMPGVIICGLAPVGADFAQPNEPNACQNAGLAWAHANGLQATTFGAVLQRTGWRFPDAVAFHQTAVFVWP